MAHEEKWKKDNDIKEEFCMACMAVPLAFAGVGVSAYGANSRGRHKKSKKIALWLGVITIIISLITAIYYLTSCKTCR